MTERIIDKLDRLGAEAEIKEMTPEIRRFALLVRQDVVAGWPKREWVGLTDEEIDDIYQGVGKNDLMLVREVEAKLREKNAKAQPAVPDAIGPNEDELPAYAAGWNDCRQLMLEMRKP